MKSMAYKQVFEGKAIEVHFVREILEVNGILSLVKEDMLSQIFPLYVTSGELQPVKIYVENDKLEEAQRLIQIYTGTNLKQGMENDT